MAQKWISRFEIRPGTWVFVPTERSVIAGRELKAAIEQRWHAPKNYFHLSPGGHLTALRAHLESAHFAHLDIQNFFGRVNKSRVTRCLKPYFGYVEARRVAAESTVAHPTLGGAMLPFGFVQSPILASLCLSKSALGRCLREIPRRLGVKVSVYVDDIILSSDEEFVLAQALQEVESAANRSGLPLNAAKREGPAAKITAFNIELSHLALAVEPDRWAKFVETFHATDSEHARRGIRGYIESVNLVQAAAL